MSTVCIALVNVRGSATLQDSVALETSVVAEASQIDLKDVNHALA